MLDLDLRSLTQPAGIIRMAEVVLTCVCFSLVASKGHVISSHWAWCMFTWCFCCFFSLFILIMEFTRFSAKVPISWDDFTTAFAMLATLMCFTSSIIYPTFFTCSTCYREIAATIISLFGFGAYAGEVVLARLRPGEISGFLSTVPGLLKILETFVACIIFTSLDPAKFSEYPGLQWCVAVYSLCFIFALVIIIFTVGQLLSLFPISFEKLVTVYNVLASMMYMTAVVIWPLYGFKNRSRPIPCPSPCTWDDLVVVTFMTVINLAIYILDTVYSIKMVFFTQYEE
ncbi:myeloid-associated differentiation marker [Esox lucius]|uniref:MARVEL domain-containing protein n=1 Tax=Esox lucius TaxID=8010 RepID=A0A6Q2XBC6_ESOLU|nr:myeloid-associated differentiation marker [Esox lucius]